MNDGRWTIKDVISTVLISMLMIVIQIAINLVCMPNDFVSMVLSTSFSAFACGVVYVLLATRVGKHSCTLIYTAMVGWDLVTTPPGDLSAFLSKMHAPVALILGVLVVFRFFPTMASELSSIVRSMRNRSLTAPSRMIAHPAASGEYVIVPLMLRCLQIADQLTVSAIARGAERNGIRSSYYGRPCEARDAIWLAVWMAGTALFLLVTGAKP